MQPIPLTIEQIQKRKSQLGKELSTAIYNFIEETGVVPSEIKYSFDKGDLADGTKQTFSFGLDIKIEI